ncbi:hypothetical protein HY622_04085 [Candidatus Uhrbacteria bacterium]|nr:hypothetical protein [Candidatus Uhrbacteria bacterium]
MKAIEIAGKLVFPLAVASVAIAAWIAFKAVHDVEDIKKRLGIRESWPW